MQQTLGKYQLGEPLGQGGMGAVYRSFHPQLNRPVAVKVMLANVAADPQAHQRFLREAQVVAMLSHPNIVNIFDVDIQDNQPYIVMDFADGGSLAAQLQAGPLSLDQALDLAIPLADALEYAHRQGVIHRDLKPANVLLRADGSPVLADFGLARPLQVLSDAQITATGALLGTLVYMAPEQFSGRAADTRADIDAFGVMLFEMLTGRIPFDGDSAQIMYGHLQQPPPAPRQLNPALPAPVERLVLQMLAKDPAARPQNMAEVAAALHSLRDSGAATGRTIALAPAPTLVAAQPASSPPPAVSVPGTADINSSRRILKGLLIGTVAAALWIGSLWLPLKPQPTDRPQIQPTSLAIAPPTRQPTHVESDPTPVSEVAASPTALELVPEPLLTSPKKVGPEPFSVAGISYRKDSDSVWFFGEVRNDGPEPRESVQVRVILRDAAGAELLSKSAATEMSYLKPGEIS